MNTPNPIHASAVDPEGKKLNGSPEAGSPAGVPAPEATPRPWFAVESAMPGFWDVASSPTGYPSMAMLTGNRPNSGADARLIAQAVNSHDALVAALRLMVRRASHFPDCFSEERNELCHCGKADAEDLLDAIARAALSQSTPKGGV